MERADHLRLLRDSLTAYAQLVDFWDRKVKEKGPIGDWPSADLDRFSREITEPCKFLKDEIGRQTEELRRHDLGVMHNDFGDSGRAKGIRQAAAAKATNG